MNQKLSPHGILRTWFTRKSKKYFMMMPGVELTREISREVMTLLPGSLPKDEAVDVRNEFLPSGLRVRIYTPKTEKAEYPGLFWIHGGGHFSGTPEYTEWLQLAFVKEIGCIVVEGGSAGGEISAAMTLMARDKKGPEIHFQALFYPQIDCRMNTPLSYQITDNRATGRNICMTALKWYLGDLSGDVPVYASPALDQLIDPAVCVKVRNEYINAIKEALQ